MVYIHLENKCSFYICTYITYICGKRLNNFVALALSQMSVPTHTYVNNILGLIATIHVENDSGRFGSKKTPSYVEYVHTNYVITRVNVENV
jgi:hypothetical protein